jgi:hypothetical protein
MALLYSLWKRTLTMGIASFPRRPDGLRPLLSVYSRDILLAICEHAFPNSSDNGEKSRYGHKPMT